jgi:hypothetical protein
VTRKIRGIVVIEAEPYRTCSVCKRVEECRPYGESGADICYPCATTPERRAATERALALRLFGAASS